jgi:predicted O-methyltransferase YrrM
MNLEYIKWEIKKKICKPMGVNRGLYLVDLVKKYNILVETVAEIGVWRGHTTIVLLKYLPTIKFYHLVDPWESYKDYEESGDNKAGTNLSVAKLICEDRLYQYSNKLVWHQAFSSEAVKEMDNYSIDLVFIDANHAYEYVKNDIKNWWPKVRRGGIISGHDYQPHFPGVCQAVDEVFKVHINVGVDSVWWKFKDE